MRVLKKTARAFPTAIGALLLLPSSTTSFASTTRRKKSTIPRTHPYFLRQSNSASRSRVPSGLFAGDAPDDERPTRSQETQAVKTTSVPLSSYLLAAITLRSLAQLLTLPTELPGALLFPDPAAPLDYLATAFDVFFVGFGAQNLLAQSGLLGGAAAGAGASPAPSLAGLECRVTLDAGRERGTMMEAAWGASGARLVLPVNLRFAGRRAEIAFPGEEALGGRFCYGLDVLDDCVTFVGPRGEVRVPVEGGCWATLPITERRADNGEAKLRFFLDFPEGAARNDVTVPAGRVFFSGVCFADAAAAPLEVGESLVVGPGNVGILAEGGMTVKRNGALNLYGALGDTNAILGRYRVDNVKIRDEGCSVG